MISGPKRSWLFVGIVVVVLAVALSLFLQRPPDIPAVSDGKLHPGAIYRGVDGVSIAAPEESIDQAFEISIIKAEDPRGEVPFPEYLSEAQVVGDFYEITAESDIWPELPYALLLGLPVPEGVPPDKLAVLLFSPPEAIILSNPEEDVDPLRWDILTGTYDPESGLFGTLFLYVGTSPQVIALVEADITSEREIPPDPWGREIFVPIRSSAHNSSGLMGGSPVKNHGHFLTRVLGFSMPRAFAEARMASQGNLALQPDDWGILGLTMMGFYIRPTGFSVSYVCPEELKDIAKDTLNEAYESWMNMGFRGPRLRFSMRSCNFYEMTMGYTLIGTYEYQLRPAGQSLPNGVYNATQGIGYTTYRHHIEGKTPCPIITRWVLFSAFQYRFEKLLHNYLELIKIERPQELWPVTLGTARVAETSPDTLTRSNDDVSLTRPKNVSYQLFVTWNILYSINGQDFWAYIGKRMNPANPQAGCFIPFFERGGLVSIIDGVLREEGTFESLGDAYWQWAKNQAFEKQVILGLDYYGVNVPHGPPGSFSGHGELNLVSLSLESWDPASGTILTPISDSRAPMQSKVYEINLKPHVSKVYEVTADVDTTFPDIRYKFYPLDEAGTTACWDEARDNQPYTFKVDEGPVTVYLLVSNTNTEAQIGDFAVNLTLGENVYQRSLVPDIPLLIPEFELKVRASRDGTYSAAIASNTGHGGSTDYTRKSIRQGTEVHLQAPEYIGSGASRKKFAGWSGAITSKQRSITFNMDSNKNLRANYEDSPELTYFTLTVHSSEDDPDQKVGIDITSKTGHGGRTRYTISSLIAGTKVHLEAPEHAGTRVNPKVFSHWSGAVSSIQRHITLVMDGNKSVTAHYTNP